MLHPVEQKLQLLLLFRFFHSVFCSAIILTTDRPLYSRDVQLQSCSLILRQPVEYLLLDRRRLNMESTVE